MLSLSGHLESCECHRPLGLLPLYDCSGVLSGWPCWPVFTWHTHFLHCYLGQWNHSSGGWVWSHHILFVLTHPHLLAQCILPLSFCILSEQTLLVCISIVPTMVMNNNAPKCWWVHWLSLLWVLVAHTWLLEPDVAMTGGVSVRFVVFQAHSDSKVHYLILYCGFTSSAAIYIYCLLLIAAMNLQLIAKMLAQPLIT